MEKNIIFCILVYLSYFPAGAQAVYSAAGSFLYFFILFYFHGPPSSQIISSYPIFRFTCTPNGLASTGRLCEQNGISISLTDADM